MLTAKELRLCKMLGEAATLFTEIAKETNLRDEDVREFFAGVHGLQNAVMAQTARRDHPEAFR